MDTLVAVDSCTLKSHETKWTKSVVDRYQNSSIVRGVAAVVQSIADAALDVGSTKDEDLDGELRVLGGIGRRPNIQI